MIRQTSIDCYNQIKKNGLLSKTRLEVYEAILKIGKPSTTREVYATMNVPKQEATRFTELRNMGVIYEVRNRKCSITGKTSIEWDLTDNLPIKKENKPIVTKKQKIQEILDEISDFGKTLSNEQDKIILRSIYLKIKSI